MARKQARPQATHQTTLDVVNKSGVDPILEIFSTFEVGPGYV